MTKINPLDFFEKYKLIGSLDLYKPLIPLRYRFCGEISQNLFKNRSHLIPELLGENDFIATDECDNSTKILGYKSRVSDIFHNTRKLNLKMIRKLYETLRIPLETLVKEY